MELKQKAAKGVFWSAAQIWGSRAISFLVLVVLSRLVGPENFGLVAMATIFIAFVQTFQDQGFGDAIIQHEDLQPEHLDTAFWTNMLMGVLLTLVSISCAGFVAGLFHQPQLTPIIRWLSLSFILAGLTSTQQAILRRQLAFRDLAIRSFSANFIAGVIGVVLAFLGFGVWSLVAQDLVYGLVEVVVLWRVSKWRPGFRFSTKHFHDLFSFGVNIIGTNILNFLNGHADDLLIGYFLGPTALGLYTIAYRLLTVMIDLLTSVTNAVAFPAFSRLQNELGRMRGAFYQVTHYTSLISFPAFIGVVLIAPELIVAVFGPQWSMSIQVLQVLAFIGILQSVFYFNGSVILAMGKPRWRLGITLLYAISNVIAFAIAVRWGIVAVAAAYVIRGYLLSPVPIWALHRLIRIDVRVYLRQFFVPLIGVLVMSMVVIGLKYLLGERLGLILRLFVYTLGGGLVYLLVIQMLNPGLYKQITDLVRLALPNFKVRRT